MCCKIASQLRFFSSITANNFPVLCSHIKRSIWPSPQPPKSRVPLRPADEDKMKRFLIASALVCGVATQAVADIKVGILHSLSGTMAISETTLKDTMLMLIDQQNAKGESLVKKSCL